MRHIEYFSGSWKRSIRSWAWFRTSSSDSIRILRHVPAGLLSESHAAAARVEAHADRARSVDRAIDEILRHAVAVDPVVVGARRAAGDDVLAHVRERTRIERLGRDRAVMPYARERREPVVAMHVLELGPGAIERPPHVVVGVDEPGC